MSDNKSNRKLAAIMFADIVSYSRLMGANETIKIIEVYDSTATGIIYNKENPYIDLKIGDNLIY